MYYYRYKILLLFFLFLAGDCCETLFSDTPPNIVLILTDQQSANMMSAAQGTTYLQTPNMDSLAAEGVRFLRAYTANPLCMPARAALFTGHYPHHTGFQTNDSKLPEPPFNGLGTYFRNSGYKTYYFGKWHLAYKRENVDRHGFELIAGKKEKQDGHDAGVTAAAVEILQEKQLKPFLAVISYLNPHDICQYPRGEKFPSGEVGIPPETEQCPPIPENWLPAENETDSITAVRKVKTALPKFPVAHYNADDWRRLRWVYNRLVEKVDNETGKIIKTLRESGNAENTLIVFSSDHGECAGSHGFNQKTVFYEESVRVPFIIVPPKKTEKKVDNRLINTGIDLLPTLLDYAGLPIPQDLPGKSLRPVVENKTPDWNRDYIIVQNQMDQFGPIEGRLVVTENFKYAVYSQGLHRESLYNLKNDPYENKNLAILPEYKSVLDANRKLLQKFAEKYSDRSAAMFLENHVAPIPLYDLSGISNEKK
jgi:choline-sulfatase